MIELQEGRPIVGDPQSQIDSKPQYVGSVQQIIDMPAPAQNFRHAARRIAANFAMYLDADDPHRHTDSPSLLSFITDASLLALAVDILPIVGHRLVEHATDALLHKAIDLKSTILKLIRTPEERRPTEISSLAANAHSDAAAIADIVTAALGKSDADELHRAIASADGAVVALARTELRFPSDKARDYAIEITRELRIAVTPK
jgi:hypothetical protein